MHFKDIDHLKPAVLSALKEMAYDVATPIQEKSLWYALNGDDIIGQAQTGTGKTGAFGIPIINSIDAQTPAFSHLILAPTRELASQIDNQLRRIGQFTEVRICLILGGISYDKQLRELKKQPHIIVATPGRINEYLTTKRIDFTNLQTFTLDEVDELLNIGFQKEIESILTFLPTKRQNFFFSATFNQKTKELAQKITNKKAHHIAVSFGLSTTETINQEYIVVREKNKWSTLIKLLEFHKPQSVIIFGRTKNRIDELNEALVQFGFSAIAIQGDMQQRERNFVLERFRKQQKQILVATDVMARGIDVDHVEWIINFDLPQEIEYYTHRIGRTGRAGKTGYSLSFVKPDEIEHIKEIAYRTKSKIIETQLPPKEQIYQVWQHDLDLKLKAILHQQANLIEPPVYLEKQLLNKFSSDQLATLLAHFLLKNQFRKVYLTPEPSVVLKGQARVRAVLKHINRFDNRKKVNKKPATSKTVKIKTRTQTTKPTYRQQKHGASNKYGKN